MSPLLARNLDAHPRWPVSKPGEQMHKLEISAPDETTSKHLAFMPHPETDPTAPESHPEQTHFGNGIRTGVDARGHSRQVLDYLTIQMTYTWYFRQILH
jgi:hypothetical protein